MRIPDGVAVASELGLTPLPCPTDLGSFQALCCTYVVPLKINPKQHNGLLGVCVGDTRLELVTPCL